MLNPTHYQMDILINIISFLTLKNNNQHKLILNFKILINSQNNILNLLKLYSKVNKIFTFKKKSPDKMQFLKANKSYQLIGKNKKKLFYMINFKIKICKKKIKINKKLKN
jgi:hypothetical protein